MAKPSSVWLQSTTVAFDKTGTLTEGTPQISAFHISSEATCRPPELLAYAAAVESASTHPLAEAVRLYTAAHSPLSTPVPENARSLAGLGAEAIIHSHHVRLGNATLLPDHCVVPQPPAGLEHATPIYLVVDNQLQGAFYASDTLRPSAPSALAGLDALQLSPVLLTGDISASAEALARNIGLAPRQVHAKLLPADKLAVISALQSQGHRVAMVGDGLNDAAALAHADAGIAMASGTGLAREAGHVLLLHPDLTLVPRAITLARRTRRLMRQNLAWAMLYNVLGIPLAAGVFLPRFHLTLTPAFASAAMALSSVSVLLNSLRLANAAR